jgi:putative peptidoglycan lipid II flippase
LIQLPAVIALLRGLTPSLAVKDEGVRTTLSNFVPVFIGRGSVQISAFIDQALASFLGERVVAAMFNAQTLYTLPVSLFGMAVSAAELPEMSSATGDESSRAEHLRKRLASALRRVVFLVVPSAVALLAIGGSIVALLFETGRFGAQDTEVVWLILAGSALGLVPATSGRLLGSAFYALGDPRSPLRAALVRVAISAAVGYAVALPLRESLGYSPAWGAFGLTAASAFAGWIELAILQHRLAKRIGGVPTPRKLLAGSLGAAAIAGAAGLGAGSLADHLGATHWAAALVAIPMFGAIYLGIMALAGVPETGALTRRLRRRR